MSAVLDRLEQPEENIRISDYLDILRRRARLLGIIVGAVLLMSVLLVLLLPSVYQSTATILIEQQEIPADLVRSTVTTYADQRLQIISQLVMTSANLVGVIRKFNLYPELQEREPREALVARMRKDIKMDLISAEVVDPRFGRPTQATIAFSVSYQSRSPDLAQKVANELTTLYLNENLKSRTDSARETSEFLSEEAEKLRLQIVDMESKLAVFKRKNINQLPENSQLSMQILDRTEREVDDVDREIRMLEERKVYLEAQLVQINPNAPLYTETGDRVLAPAGRLKSLEAREMSMSALYSPTHPDLLKARKEIAALRKELGIVDSVDELEARLDAARADLAQASKKYAPDHPDIKRLSGAVANLEQGLEQSRQTTAAKSANAKPDNPAYLQLQSQYDAANGQIVALRAKHEELIKKRNEYERRLSSTPRVESEYRAMTRDHENSQRKFQEVKAKLLEAQLAQSLESERKGERFTLIEPPMLPEQAASPQRMTILLLGVIFSLMAGASVVTGAEVLDRSVRGSGDLQRLFNTPPLAVIPYIDNSSDLARYAQRRLWVRRGLIAAAVGFLALVVIVHFFIKPLDVAWFQLLRKLGY